MNDGAPVRSPAWSVPPENFRLREGEVQARRARASWRYGEHLRAECELLGVPCLSATPWETLLDRALGMIEGRE